MWVLALFAQAGQANKDPFRQPEVIWGTAGLAVALLAGAFVIWLVDRWRKRSVQKTSGEELTDFRGMFERGEITEEEYNRLRTRVAQRIKPPGVDVVAAPPQTDVGNAQPESGSPPNPPPPA